MTESIYRIRRNLCRKTQPTGTVTFHLTDAEYNMLFQALIRDRHYNCRCTSDFAKSIVLEAADKLSKTRVWECNVDYRMLEHMICTARYELDVPGLDSPYGYPAVGDIILAHGPGDNRRKFRIMNITSLESETRFYCSLQKQWLDLDERLVLEPLLNGKQDAPDWYSLANNRLLRILILNKFIRIYTDGGNPYPIVEITSAGLRMLEQQGGD